METNKFFVMTTAHCSMRYLFYVRKNHVKVLAAKVGGLGLITKSLALTKCQQKAAVPALITNSSNSQNTEKSLKKGGPLVLHCSKLQYRIIFHKKLEIWKGSGS